jgi:hypothetical protein
MLVTFFSVIPVPLTSNCRHFFEIAGDYISKHFMEIAWIAIMAISKHILEIAKLSIYKHFLEIASPLKAQSHDNKR